MGIESKWLLYNKIVFKLKIVLKIPQNNEKFVYIDDDHTQWLYTMLLQNPSTDLYLDLYRYQLNFDKFI